MHCSRVVGERARQEVLISYTVTLSRVYRQMLSLCGDQLADRADQYRVVSTSFIICILFRLRTTSLCTPHFPGFFFLALILAVAVDKNKHGPLCTIGQTLGREENTFAAHLSRSLPSWNPQASYFLGTETMDAREDGARFSCFRTPRIYRWHGRAHLRAGPGESSYFLDSKKQANRFEVLI